MDQVFLPVTGMNCESPTVNLGATGAAGALRIESSNSTVKREGRFIL